jgi:hypothetical protein
MQTDQCPSVNGTHDANMQAEQRAHQHMDDRTSKHLLAKKFNLGREN